MCINIYICVKTKHQLEEYLDPKAKSEEIGDKARDKKVYGKINIVGVVIVVG